jgi:hypothetical protein
MIIILINLTILALDDLKALITVLYPNTVFPDFMTSWIFEFIDSTTFFDFLVGAGAILDLDIS